MELEPHPARESPEEFLTRQFYEWEIRGRGWHLWEKPVDIEPPFRPFHGHFLPPVLTWDDGRKPTRFSSLLRKVTQLLDGSTQCTANPPFLEEGDQKGSESEPLLLEDRKIVELRCLLPPNLSVSKEVFEQFLFSLSSCRSALAFEILGTAGKIVVQLAADETDMDHVESQIEGYFPEAVFTRGENSLLNAWQDTGDGKQLVVEMGLSKEFMLPINVQRNLTTDPIISIAAALSKLESQEVGLFQVLFQPTRNPWHSSVIRAVSGSDGGCFFSDYPEFQGQAKTKTSRPFFAAVVRIAAKSKTESRVWQLMRALFGTFSIFKNPSGNEFIPLENEGYDPEDHESDMLLRRSRRFGMLLNSDEFISLVHLPSSAVRASKLERETSKTKEAPDIALNQSFKIGINEHSGQEVSVSLNSEQRLRHIHVIGASGTGKSNFLLNLIVQDIEAGEGIGVLDPHGELIDKIIQYIPEHRLKDVILFDPADAEFPIGFNILTAHSDLEKNLLSSDLVSVFQRLSTSWGDQMTSVLGNGILAMLESTSGGTLADLRRFLIEPEFRKEFLKTVQDKEIVYYWKKEFPFLSGKPQGPVLTRLDTFLRPKTIRHMVSQKANRVDFGEIMNSGKILLAKLSQGLIGKENAYLLGTLLVSKFHQTAMSRQSMEANSRKNYWLFIDEFHNFITPSMAEILSGTRKYGLGLILAHQELRQLQKDQDVASAVISNPYTRICFRVGDDDARKLSEGFSFFEAKDLQNLGTGKAICRIERSEFDFNLKTEVRQKVDKETAQMKQASILENSRKLYGTPKQQVEDELFKSRQTDHEDEDVPKDSESKRKKEVSQKEAVSISIDPIAEAKSQPPARPAAILPLPPPILPEQTPSPLLEKFDLLKPEAPSAKKRRTKIDPADPGLMGRGGKEHKAIQNRIKKYAEDLEYKTTIEMPILDGKGSVDIVLEKPKRTIAVEISITNTVEYEVGNLQKCVLAGFESIAMVSNDPKRLEGIYESACKVIDTTQFKKIQFFLPQEFENNLNEMHIKDASLETKSGKYTVKVNYRAANAEEVVQYHKDLGKMVADSVWKRKIKNPLQ